MDFHSMSVWVFVKKLLSFHYAMQDTILSPCRNSAPAKKLKVNLTLPLEVDQTTTMYS